MSIKSLLVVAVMGISAFALAGCVADSGSYYYDDGRYYGSGHYAGSALILHSGPRYVHPRASRSHRSYRPHRPRYEGPRYRHREMRRERRQEARRERPRPPRHEERRHSNRSQIARDMADRARTQERSWP